MMHGRLRRRLSEFLDGSLGERDRQRVDRHLAECEPCRTELAELRGTVALLRGLPALEPPPELTARVLAQLGAGAAEPSVARRLRAALGDMLGGAWAPAFGSVALLLVVAALLRVQIQVHLPFGPGREQALPPLAESARVVPAPEIAPQPSAPLAPRRRFDAIEPASSVQLANASGLRRACLARPHDAACHAFHLSMMRLALEDTPAFVAEVDAVEPTPRERWLGVLSREAERAGAAARVASKLRASSDPRAVGIAVSFERPLASRE